MNKTLIYILVFLLSTCKNDSRKNNNHNTIGKDSNSIHLKSIDTVLTARPDLIFNDDSLKIKKTKVLEYKNRVDSLKFPTFYDFSDEVIRKYEYYIGKAYNKEKYSNVFQGSKNKILDSLIKVYEKNIKDTINGK
jgi:hypothetical protein